MIRASIQGLVINIIQSLCTCIPADHPNLKTLNSLMSDFSEPKFKLLFGLNRNHINAFSHTIEATTDSGEPMPLASLESIVQSLLSVMRYGSASIDQSNIWRARWMSLVTSTAFQFNPAVQPRAFIVLGCLARGEVDDDLLYQILVALRGALELFDNSDCNLIISIILCLSNIVKNLPADSRYLLPMFWLSLAFIQIGHMPLVASAINLVEVVLKRMHHFKLFRHHSPASVLMKAREPFHSEAKELEKCSKVSFSTDFSFAFSCILIRGLKQSNTKSSTLSVLQTMLKLSYNKDIIPVIGFLAPQLPIAAKNGNLKPLLSTLHITDFPPEADDTSYLNYYKILFKLRLENNDSDEEQSDTVIILLIAMMVGLLHHTEFEEEYLFLYGFLAEMALEYFEVFTYV